MMIVSREDSNLDNLAPANISSCQLCQRKVNNLLPDLSLNRYYYKMAVILTISDMYII